MLEHMAVLVHISGSTHAHTYTRSLSLTYTLSLALHLSHVQVARLLSALQLKRVSTRKALEDVWYACDVLLTNVLLMCTRKALEDV